jgi:hypothetical protein
MGYSGFKTQMLIWLSGPLDAARLRQALARLSRRHPVVASRLIETDDHDDAEAFWSFCPGEICPLHEAQLASNDKDAALAYAAKLLSAIDEPTRVDPIAFHLLHRPDGRDIFLMQYNHMLMDNNATPGVVRLLDRLSQVSPEEADPAAAPRNPIRQFLRRVPYAKRRAAALEAVNLQGRALRGRAAVLGKAEEDAPRNIALQIATRSMAAEEASDLRDQVVQICGFPSLSMAILGSVFRAIGQLAPQHRNAGRNFAAGIGLEVCRRTSQTVCFENLMSLVPISAPQETLHDREALIRFLSHQMRDRLASRIDVGAVQLTATFSRRPRYIRWVVEHLLRYATSLWYAFFGSLDSLGDEFCGVGIDDVMYAGPTWSPVGLTLLVNQYRGKLSFQATYDPELVPPSLANEFLDFVLSDLPRRSATSGSI